jgi:hypothetical protein
LFFSEDAFILLECTIQYFMKSQKCFICSALFEIKETIKVCSECFIFVIMFAHKKKSYQTKNGFVKNVNLNMYFYVKYVMFRI